MAKFAAKDSNKNITLSPHGTGKVVVGTGAADATVQSDGNHNLVLQTGNATTGSISITDGADGDIAISPNGTGTVVVNTDLDVDNINVNGNAITSTNTDGNIDLTPNGTGEVNISKVDIDSGTIDGTDITVGSSKTLNVSAGTLTTSTAQKTAIVDGGKGNLTKSDVGLSNVTNDAQVPASGGSFTGNVSFSDNNITNVGDISLDTISSDAGTSIGVTLGTDSGDDFNVGSGKLVVEGDTGRTGIGNSAPDNILHIKAADPCVWIEDTETSGPSAVVDLRFAEGTGPDNWVGLGMKALDLVFYTGNSGNTATTPVGTGNVRMTVKSTGKVGIGTDSPDTLLEVNAGAAACITTDRSNSGAHIQFDSNGAEKGSISESGGTVSYNPFTGSHYGWIDGSCELGKVLIMTGINQHAYNDATQEIIYGIEECSTENDSKFLGTYLSVMNPDNDRTIGDSDNSANPDLVMAVGNGKMWVVDEGSNITQGDHLITSSTQGHARKDPQTATFSYVIGRAGEPVNWSEVSETVGSKKHKLISVLFDVCIVKN